MNHFVKSHEHAKSYQIEYNCQKYFKYEARKFSN